MKELMNYERIIESIASKCKQITGKNQTYRRMELFEALCKAYAIEFEFVGEKPDGKACVIKEMSNCYRFFPRCGYGRYNYSPCYEIEKVQ